MNIGEILSDIKYETYPAGSEALCPDIDGVVYDSRRAAPGKLFVCLRGARTDGHDHAAAAYAAGVRAFMCERRLDIPADACQFIVQSTRKGLARASFAFFGHPERELTLIGITGTKGKTSAAGMIHSVLVHSGRRAVLIGTAGTVDADGRRLPNRNTTPESFELARIFADAVRGGARYAVLEVSSQAYLMHRVEGLEFSVGVFTNLSEDHIGEFEHPDMENYRYCKSRLFAHSDISVINEDDPEADYMKSAARGEVFGYGLGGSCARAENIRSLRGTGHLGVSFDMFCRGEKTEIQVNYPGLFSVYNALAAASVCVLLGIPCADISRGIEAAYIPGRFEIIPVSQDITAVIDYAHNGLSLRSALTTLRGYAPKRLVCLFGSVGGRTRLRRSELGSAAGKYADFCILTSDNPDFENPDDIIADIEEGIAPTGCPYVCIPDRGEAVRCAIRKAKDGDIILFAGKGHEDFQLIRGEKRHFSEKEIILEAVAERESVSAGAQGELL